jgi:peptide/nickel transport system permease protein
VSTLSVAVERTAPWRDRLARSSVSATLAALGALVLLIALVAPSLLTHASPTQIDPPHSLLAPSWQHLFGTDEDGRDEFARVVYGTRPALFIGFVGAGIGALFGTALGLAAGIGGRFADGSVSRLTELMLAFPGLVLALLLSAFLGASVTVEAIAVGLGNVPTFVRVVRAQTLQVNRSPYVAAARALGHGRSRVIALTVVPNVVRPLLAFATLAVGQSIVWGTALSFLGLGAKPPAAEWGLMLSNSQSYLQVAWWLAVFPGLAIVATSLSITTLGGAAQRRLDGRRSL